MRYKSQVSGVRRRVLKWNLISVYDDGRVNAIRTLLRKATRKQLSSLKHCNENAASSLSENVFWIIPIL